MVKKVLSWIFTSLAYVALVVCVLLGVFSADPDDLIDGIIFGVIFFLVLLLVAFLLFINCDEIEGAQRIILMILTFPLVIVFYVVKYIIKGIKAIVYAISGKSPNTSSARSGKVYVISVDGFERQLTMIRKNLSDDWSGSDNPYFGKYYNSFRDDLGNYWRSYDGNDTFVSEDEMSRKGWKA